MSKYSFPEYAGCPVANICAVTQPGGPECGTVYDHLFPLNLAEQLCPKALQRGIRDLPKPKDDIAATINHSIDMAWARLEWGLNPRMPADWAKEYFEDARIYATRAVEAGRSARFSQALEGSLFLLHLPGFRARRPEGTALTPRELATVKRGWAVFTEVGCAAEIHRTDDDPAHWDRAEHAPVLRRR